MVSTTSPTALTGGAIHPLEGSPYELAGRFRTRMEHARVARRHKSAVERRIADVASYTEPPEGPVEVPLPPVLEAGMDAVGHPRNPRCSP